MGNKKLKRALWGFLMVWFALLAFGVIPSTYPPQLALMCALGSAWFLVNQ